MDFCRLKTLPRAYSTPCPLGESGGIIGKELAANPARSTAVVRPLEPDDKK